MRTLPDTIDLIKNKFIRILDCYYSIIESLGVKFTNYAWHKRWSNRETGTGYRKNKWNHLNNISLKQSMDLK